MSTKVSKLWLVGPPFAIAVAALAYYAKFESARTWVDARVPWVAENIGQRLPPLAPEGTALSPIAEPPETAPPNTAALPSRDAGQISYVAADGTVRLPLLAANKAAWPKTVHLRRPLEFPAVVAGKAVGKVVVPAGSTANLVTINGPKLGLEYKGGGAWADPSETDLAEQLRSQHP